MRTTEKSPPASTRGGLRVRLAAASRRVGFVGAADLAELPVGVADEEVAARVAHGGAAVAASARLMEHEWSVLPCEFPQQRCRLLAEVAAGAAVQHDLVRGGHARRTGMRFGGNGGASESASGGWRR